MYDARGADGPPGEADECSHARLLPDHCVDRARAASTGAALAAGSSLLGDRQDARSHHRAPGLQPGGGASRLHRLPAIPDAQLAAAGFRQCDGRDRAEPARHHSLRSGAGGRRVVPDAHGRAVVQEAGEGEMNEWGWPRSIQRSATVLEMRETEAAARTLGIEVVPLEIRRVADFSPAFQAFRGNADALYVAIDQLMVANLMRILTLALGARLPTIFSTRDFVRGGGFMSYGPSYTERFARAADYVDKILRGAKPGEIPVEQPTKFELVVNLITAQALGLEVPPTLLARADEVIE